MSARRLAVLVLAVAASLVLTPIASADAAVVVRTDPGGALLGGATTAQWTSTDRLTLLAIGGVVSCTHSAIDVTLAANSGASTVPGQVNAVSFGACTGPGGGTSPITGCALHGSTAVVLDSTATGGTLHTGITMRCPIDNTFPVQACYYRWLVTFTYDNTTGVVTWPVGGVSAIAPTPDALSTTICAGPSGVTVIQGSWTGLVDQSGNKITVTTS